MDTITDILQSKSRKSWAANITYNFIQRLLPSYLKQPPTNSKCECEFHWCFGVWDVMFIFHLQWRGVGLHCQEKQNSSNQEVSRGFQQLNYAIVLQFRTRGWWQNEQVGKTQCAPLCWSAKSVPYLVWEMPPLSPGSTQGINNEAIQRLLYRSSWPRSSRLLLLRDVCSGLLLLPCIWNSTNCLCRLTTVPSNMQTSRPGP